MGQPRLRSVRRPRRPRAGHAATGARSSSCAAARTRTSGAFSGWIRPTNSSTARRAPARAVARGLGRPRGEDAEVDTGRHDGDPRRVGAVQVDQLGRLRVGVGDQPVGGSDDLGLTDDPGARLRGVAVGEQRVLDLRHGVHRVDQRYPPAILREVPDLAGEPVVRVHEVVVAGLALGLDAQHSGCEGAEQRGQVLLGHRLERAGRDVPHQDTGSELDGGGQLAGRGPGEDLDLDAELGQAAWRSRRCRRSCRRRRRCRAGPAARCGPRAWPPATEQDAGARSRCRPFVGLWGLPAWIGWDACRRMRDVPNSEPGSILPHSPTSQPTGTREAPLDGCTFPRWTPSA